MNNIENMTLEELEKIASNPGKSGLTIFQLKEVLKAIEFLMNETERLSGQGYTQLTFWGKVKSLFSKKPVYTKGDKKNG